MDSLRAYYHQDGEWDVSMSNLEEDLDWVQTLTLETEDGTEITIDRGGRIQVEGNLKIKSKRE